MELKPEVANKYDLQVVQPGCYCFPSFGVIDLTAMDVKQADRLVSDGFPWLKLKEPKADTSKAKPMTVKAAAAPAPAVDPDGGSAPDNAETDSSIEEKNPS